MKTNTQLLLTELEGLLSFEVRQAAKHDAELIRITTPRARDLARKIRAELNQFKRPAQPAFFKHLDTILV